MKRRRKPVPHSARRVRPSEEKPAVPDKNVIGLDGLALALVVLALGVIAFKEVFGPSGDCFP